MEVAEPANAAALTAVVGLLMVWLGQRKSMLQPRQRRTRCTGCGLVVGSGCSCGRRRSHGR